MDREGMAAQSKPPRPELRLHQLVEACENNVRYCDEELDEINIALERLNSRKRELQDFKEACRAALSAAHNKIDVEEKPVAMGTQRLA